MLKNADMTTDVDTLKTMNFWNQYKCQVVINSHFRNTYIEMYVCVYI